MAASKNPVINLPFTTTSYVVTVKHGTPYKDSGGNMNDWNNLSPLYTSAKSSINTYNSKLEALKSSSKADYDFFICLVKESTNFDSLIGKFNKSNECVIDNKTLKKSKTFNTAGSVSNQTINSALVILNKAKNAENTQASGYDDNTFFPRLFLHPGTDFDIHGASVDPKNLLGGGYSVDRYNNIINKNKTYMDILKTRPICAVADGRVLFKGLPPNDPRPWQAIVYIEHQVTCNKKTFYFYASYNHLHPGALEDFEVNGKVFKGDKLGILGYGSTSSGVHLHFEIRATASYTKDTLGDAGTSHITLTPPGNWGMNQYRNFNMLLFAEEKNFNYSEIDSDKKIFRYILDTSELFNACQSFLLGEKYTSNKVTIDDVIKGYKNPIPTLEEINKTICPSCGELQAAVPK